MWTTLSERSWRRERLMSPGMLSSVQARRTMEARPAWQEAGALAAQQQQQQVPQLARHSAQRPAQRPAQ